MTRQDLAAGENNLVSSQVVAKVDHLWLMDWDQETIFFKVVDESAPEMQRMLTRNGDALLQV